MRKLIYPVLIVLVSVVFYFVENKLDKNYYQEQVDEVSGEENSTFDYLPTSTTKQVVKHAYYTLSYNEKHEQPEWVAYHLKKEHLKYNDFKRPYFEVDPLVKTNSASWRNYKNSGYDRGHFCPAADRKFSKKAFDETFLTSNIAPQLHVFNAGIWNDLEKKVRYKTKKEGDLYIVTGPVFGSSKKSIGSEHVTVPTHFFKVILKNKGASSKMVAFLMPHNTTSRKLKDFIISTDKLESLLGIDFFKGLPNDLEEKLESKRNTSWF